MKITIGIDVGGTFTDFLVSDSDGRTKTCKVLSTPADPSIAVIDGIDRIARDYGLSLAELGPKIERIVHGTTVTTNAVLTMSGAKTALLTNEGLRDALEMRRGIREERYNNHYANVPPLVPRHLRLAIGGRIDVSGREIVPLSEQDIEKAIDCIIKENVESIAICFIHSYANPIHEVRTAKKIRQALPGCYLTVSSELLPCIRFYDRVSTTVLNSYVGPKLTHYLDHLVPRLKQIGFDKELLIMQSNGGVISPELATLQAANTLLSGPAAGPGAGLLYAKANGYDKCITVDMGGTSFDVAMVEGGKPVLASEGEINRYRITLPMLDIVTIGAGGGSIGWIDGGGLLRMGPKSAGADPGPVCYGRGGSEPTSTDADLVLGYLNPDFFAGGKLKLDRLAAETAIREKIAKPLGLSIEQAASGMYRVVNNNMAHGVREISIKRGFDPREFPLIVAGGAGPIHACAICQELEIPLLIVPGESSIFCAAGMLISDLVHDFAQSLVGPLDLLDQTKLSNALMTMTAKGNDLLDREGIDKDQRIIESALDLRYARQYHELTIAVPFEALLSGNIEAIASLFHEEHNRMYGYALEEEGTAIELINLRIKSIGKTGKPAHLVEGRGADDRSTSLKGHREIYLPELLRYRSVPVYDGHLTRSGNLLPGPGLIEQINTTILIGTGYDCLCHSEGSFVLYAKGREDLLSQDEVTR